ncbi:MAG: LacI family DNA-binding transcriptional regulator [Ruminococcus sp.]|nr:LacI family DNA-binding transcriptional regulator [Ruminococcus sp.]
MVSLKDISVRCGVSVATVSKALNGHKDVSEATKERLIKAAKEMGYFPNSQARALKTNRTYNLGVMFLDEAGSGLTHEFFARLLNSFKIEAEGAGYDITFINRDMGSRKMTTYEHCKYRNVDGVIIACTDFSSSDVYEVINGDIPVVTIDHTFEMRSSVLSNNEQGIEELVDYTYSMGHKKIAYIQGNRSAVAEKRLKGFLQSMSSKGLEIKSDWIITAEYHNPELTYKYTRQLLEGSDRPTCIFMPDDYSAIGGYNAIKDMGLIIGKDVSVVGYDGIAYATLVSPKLTTYAQDTEKIGVAAARKLVALIEEPQTTFHEVITIGGSLVKGESVGKIN